MVNKEDAILEWIRALPYEGGVFLLDWLDSKAGDCAIVPVSDMPHIDEYADGSREMQYDFMLQITLRLSDATDNTNAENMFTIRRWQAWLEDQETVGNYPAFGEKCSNYEIIVLSNMPQLTQIQENQMAIYQFPARITYLEEV